MEFASNKLTKIINDQNNTEYLKNHEIEKLNMGLFCKQSYFPEHINENLEYINNMLYAGKMKIETHEEDLWKYVEDGLAFTTTISFKGVQEKLSFHFSEWYECIDEQYHIHYNVKVGHNVINARIMEDDFEDLWSQIGRNNGTDKIKEFVENVFGMRAENVFECLFCSYIGNRFSPELFNIF